MFNWECHLIYSRLRVQDADTHSPIPCISNRICVSSRMLPLRSFLSLCRCLAEAEAEVAEVKSNHQAEMDNVTRLAESQRATFDVEKEMIEATLRDVSAQLEVARSGVHAEKEGQRVAIEAYAALKRELTSVH